MESITTTQRVRLVRTVAPFSGVHGSGLSEAARRFAGAARAFGAATCNQLTVTMPDPQLNRTHAVVLDGYWALRTWSPPV